jgi:hypothetical protein
MHAMSTTTRAALFAIAGAAAIVAGAVSAPVHVALVEDVSGHPAGVELMDYVEPGQVIRLGPGDRLVLGYLRSCVRETITGGTVTVGTENSQIEAGRLEREKMRCDGARMLRAADAGPAAGMTFRGSPPHVVKPQFTLFGSSPMLELSPPGRVVIERVDQLGERHVIDAGKEKLAHAAFYDFADTGKALKPGGTYRAGFGRQELVFKIDEDAKPGRTPIVGRLLRFTSSDE